MNAPLLTEEFHLLATAPNGVQKLRELILSLAVRGKLVPQDPTDEPASELLTRINAEALMAGKAQKVKIESPPSPPIDCPYDIPSGWDWTVLGDTGRIFNGNSVSETGKNELAKVKEGYPFIATKDVGYGRDALAYENGLKVSFAASGFKVAHAGAVLICAEGGSAGRKVGQTDRDICFGNKLLANETWSGIDPRYVFSLYQSPFFRKEFGERMTGIIGGISRSEFLAIPVPIPPLGEQHRIVAKVDELMELCDQLDGQQTMQAEAHERLVATLLANLTQSVDAAAFVGNWTRIVEHFDLLFDTPESIDKLNQTVLQLAVQGKLVAQNPKDEPASELLKQAQARKDHLVNIGEIKASKPLSMVSRDEIPYELAEGWEWTRLGWLSEIVSGFAFKSELFKKDGEHQVLRLGNIRPDYIRTESNPVYIDARQASASVEYRLIKDDILITMTGTREKRDYLYTAQVPCNPMHGKYLYLNQRVGAIRPFVASSYLNKVLKVECLKDLIYATATGTANQANIGISSLREWLIPLPPLAEQHRIVAKVDELMAVCDALAARLNAARELSSKLVTAAAEAALA